MEGFWLLAALTTHKKWRYIVTVCGVIKFSTILIFHLSVTFFGEMKATVFLNFNKKFQMKTRIQTEDS